MLGVEGDRTDHNSADAKLIDNVKCVETLTG